MISTRYYLHSEQDWSQNQCCAGIYLTINSPGGKKKSPDLKPLQISWWTTSWRPISATTPPWSHWTWGWEERRTLAHRSWCKPARASEVTPLAELFKGTAADSQQRDRLTMVFSIISEAPLLTFKHLNLCLQISQNQQSVLRFSSPDQTTKIHSLTALEQIPTIVISWEWAQV